MNSGKKIVFNIKKYLEDKNMSQKDLADKMGVSDVKLSRNINGSSIKLETLAKICEILEVEPGQILKIQDNSKNKIIPMFLDYTGTTDVLLSGGVENVQEFFESIIAFQEKAREKIGIFMVTGSSQKSAQSKFTMLNQLAENYGLENLFIGVVSEYCGFLTTKFSNNLITPMHQELFGLRDQIENIVKSNGGEITNSVLTFYNSMFPDDISRSELARICEEFELFLSEQNLSDEIEILSYYDDYGKEIDIKPKKHNKALAVFECIKVLKEKFDIDMVIVGGDSQVEDLKMYKDNKISLENDKILPVFIAPSNIGKINDEDPNIIVGNWENAKGVVDALNILRDRMIVLENGGYELWEI